MKLKSPSLSLQELCPSLKWALLFCAERRHNLDLPSLDSTPAAVIQRETVRIVQIAPGFFNLVCEWQR